MGVKTGEKIPVFGEKIPPLVFVFDENGWKKTALGLFAVGTVRRKKWKKKKILTEPNLT